VELPLVAGVDGSDPSLAAVDWAAREAERHGMPLRVVFGSRWERYEGFRPGFSRERSSGEILAQHVVASGAERAERLTPDVKVSADAVPDDGVSVLLDEGRHAYAVVLGQRGRGKIADRLLGSTCLTVAARATCPVVIVRGQGQSDGAGGGVVLGIGEIGESKAAAEFALREARARHTTLTVVRAWRRPLMVTVEEEGSEGAREAEAAIDNALGHAAEEFGDVPVERRIVEGGAKQALLTVADRTDLLVVGARRRTLPVGMQLGPVNHAVLHQASCPVAVVPEQHG
jgi:nucleotide-binding universal stress UspA family protein